MVAMDGLLAVLDLRVRDARKASRPLGSIRAIYFLLFIVCLAAAIWTGFVALRYGWETGQWGVEYQEKLLNFMLYPAECLLPWCAVIMWPLSFPTLRQLVYGAAALRDYAAENAGAIPAATDILAVLDSIAAPTLPAEFGPFRRANRSLRNSDLGAGACLLLIGLSLVGIVITLLIAAPQWISWPRVATFGIVVVGLALCAAGIALLAEAVRLGRRVRVQANEMGLRWERVFPRRGEDSIPWDAIRAIFVISHTRRLDGCLACVVASSSAALAFDLSPQTPAAQVADANRLAKLVLVRTGLPLLDQTKVAENFSMRRYTPQYRAAYEVLTRPGEVSQPGALRLPPPITTPRFVKLVVLCLLPLLLIPGVALSGIALQRYQVQTYTALLAEARAHTPLYHDALSAPDSDWPVHGPTSSDPNSYSFANGGYLITPAAGTSAQDTPFVEVYAPGTYHDAVVEVTLRMASGGVPYGSAALALHALSGDAGGNLHFGINGDGSWGVLDLGHCPPGASGSNDSTCGYDSTDQASVIHHAAWAPNTLTAILRGNQVICFINGVYVGSTVALGPQSGRLGLGVEGLGVPVAFSDFTIYPL